MKLTNVKNMSKAYYLNVKEGDQVFVNGEVYLFEGGLLKNVFEGCARSGEDTEHNLPSYYNIPGLKQPLMDIMFVIAKHNTENIKEQFYLCNALKYLARYGNKNGTDDLVKAIDYIERIKALHEPKKPTTDDMEEFWEGK